jgi:hypothetical protein
MVLNRHAPFSQAPIHCYRRIDGLDIQMDRTGRPRITFVQSERGQQIRALYHFPFGHTATLWGFQCAVQTSRLRCINPAKHGFWLGPMKGYRRF